MKYRVITIEREYASGGTQVGKLAGRALGIPVYGREILEMVAQEGHTTPEYIEHLEETDTNSLLYSLVAMAKTVKGQLPEISRTDQLNLLEGADDRAAWPSKGPLRHCGAVAGWVLRERDDVLNVFIHAGRQERLRRAVEEYQVPESQAAAVLHRFDHRRSNFYHANTGLSWREREGYHMVKGDAPERGEAGLRQQMLGELACEVLLGNSTPLYARLYQEGLINRNFSYGYDSVPGCAFLAAGGESRDPEAVRPLWRRRPEGLKQRAWTRGCGTG